MPTKNVVHTARAANRDLELKFYYGDESATPPNAPRVRLFMTADVNGGSAVQTYIFDSAISALTSLSGAQKTQLGQALLSIRDEAIASLGFTG